MHHRAAGKVQRRKLAAQRRVQQTTLAPHHVRHRAVHQKRPQDHEHQHRRELHPLRKRPGNQRRRDDRKHQLIHHERLQRNRRCIVLIRREPHAVQQHILKAADKRVADAKGQRVRHQRPQYRHHAHQRERLHERPQHVLLAHQAAVEEEQPGNAHHQHQRRRDQHPAIIPCRLRGLHLRLQRRNPRLRGQRGSRRRRLRPANETATIAIQHRTSANATRFKDLPCVLKKRINCSPSRGSRLTCR